MPVNTTLLEDMIRDAPMNQEAGIITNYRPVPDMVSQAGLDEVDIQSDIGDNMAMAPMDQGPDSLYQSIINDAPNQVNAANPVSWTDYLVDIPSELAAGIAEGVTLGHEQFGNIGPETLPGDIARGVGQFGGEVGTYLGLSALITAIASASGGIALPALAKAGLTAFSGAMLRKPEEDEDMIDKVTRGLESAGLSMAVVGAPILADKAILKFAGGNTGYMAKVKQHLVDKLTGKGFSNEEALIAGRKFEEQIMANGGPRAFNAAAIRRVAKAKKGAAESLRTIRKIYADARGGNGLGLNNDQFALWNMAQTGKFHTSQMNAQELSRLNKFYGSAVKRLGRGKPKDLNYVNMLKEQAPKFDPSYAARHEPVERVMIKAGLGRQFEGVYDANVNMLSEQQGFSDTFGSMMKGVNKQQKKALFHLMNETVIPEDAALGRTPGVVMANIKSLYAANAARYGVDPANVDKAVYMRRTMRDLLGRMNSVLVAEGKNPIQERGAYIPHLLNEQRQAIGGIPAWMWQSIKTKGATGTSRFLKERTGSVDIVEDAAKAYSSYVRSALKMIHMKPAVRNLRSSMNQSSVFIQHGRQVAGKQLSRDVKLPNTFTPDMWKFVDDWEQHGVFELPTQLDRGFNKIIGRSGQLLAHELKMASYLGTLWGNPKSAIKNMTQQTLNVAKLGKYWIDGMASFNPKVDFYRGMNGWKFAETNCKLLKGRMPALEGMDPTTMGRMVKIGFSPFRAVDKANIVAGFNGAFKRALDQGKTFNDAVNIADRLVRSTQFNYLNIDTPLAWLSSPGRLGSQFQSWWTRYAQEVWSWGGHMPYGDGTNRYINVARKSWNVAKSKEMFRYLGINLSLLYALKKAGLGAGLIESSVPIPGIQSGPFPTSLPPALSTLFHAGGTLYGLAVGDEVGMKRNYSKFSRAIMTHIPGYTPYNNISKVVSGKRPPKTIFLPTSKAERDRWARRAF